jgi:hypothetical protein
MRGISLLAEDMLVSQEGMCSMELAKLKISTSLEKAKCVAWFTETRSEV